MMQTDDKTGFGIGIGYMLGELKFNTYFSKSSSAKSGYRLRRSVEWHKEPSLHILPYIQQVLDIANLDYKGEGYSNNKEQERLRLLINTLDKEYRLANAFSDAEGYHMWIWTYDNPLPSNYEEIEEWAKAYDSEYEMITEYN
tara:strand:+ start:962 stop:1387 length:426 start_codon:yes stop_codon:yes gene_type:complete